MTAAFAAAARLDDLLGDPWRTDNVYGFEAGVARDARGDFPHAFAARLDSVDFPLAYLPPSLGGALRGLDDTLLLVRVAARRDAAIMPATLLSCSAVLTVLAAGTPEQAKTVADWVQEGRTIAFALSEEHSGSDVLAGECRLDPAQDGGFRLTGRKWLVGRGATADAAVVVARTAARGPAAFTAVLLGPRELSRVRRQPAQPVTGMRGIDFADLAFDGTPVPQEAVIGGPGGGLAGAMRAQQVVRLLSTAACLATADTALRTALRFTQSRRIGGVRVADTAHGSRELAVAAAELFAADLLSLTAARYAHLSPATFGLCSSVVKRAATRLTASTVSRSRSLLGARGVLAHGPGAVVDKAQRDNAIVESFDTSPFGVLRAVALQLPAYAPTFAHWTRPAAQTVGAPELPAAGSAGSARPGSRSGADVVVPGAAGSPALFAAGRSGGAVGGGGLPAAGSGSAAGAESSLRPGADAVVPAADGLGSPVQFGVSARPGGGLPVAAESGTPIRWEVPAGGELAHAAVPVAPAGLDALFAFGEPLPGLEPGALDLSVRPKDLVLLGFAAHAEELARDLTARGEERAAGLVRDVRTGLAHTFATAAEAQRDRSRGLGASAELLDLADRCCLLYAAAAAALAWHAQPDRGLYGEGPAGAGWLTAVLAVLLAMAEGRDPRQAASELPPAARAVTSLDAARLLFTAFPVQLSDGPAPEEDETT
ncbi:acyl-CoA dehydrogenase family protein [Streptomyces sp. TLI_185]|uniref:acyl-CoA dehydrogenase family protein n=1 Tax=Streptomyces sp. TLI_185 TaxID=2485151 RepID=UPI000F511F80|nr:acyl-CoA dehydrogenase family protein [Streptomyces sp. TLI_185]RPF32262.1 alkylation response protein AidB-like acyl-CoA dehydrogenase [Streptomyces sp. TLI_185]